MSDTEYGISPVMPEPEFIEFTDKLNGKVYVRRNAITAVLIKSPLGPDNLTSAILWFGVQSPVEDMTALRVAKELGMIRVIN